MKVLFLSASSYNNPESNNGDCILIDNGYEMVVYDCGCEEHAKRALQYMNSKGYHSMKVVLSHNDSDHFDGIQYLVDNNAVSEVYALLLLKYKNDLLELLNDKRRNSDSIGQSIKDIFSNIASLSGKVCLKDIFEYASVTDGIVIVGPDKDYALDAIAKRIDKSESDYIDKETIVNAVSTQLSIKFDSGKKLLLTGDSCFEAIETSIKNHDAIQLPHHGKLDPAEAIFAKKSNTTIYFVSDNTGNSNGGSSELCKKHPRGHVIYNTLDGDQCCEEASFSVTSKRGSYYRGY